MTDSTNKKGVLKLVKDGKVLFIPNYMNIYFPIHKQIQRAFNVQTKAEKEKDRDRKNDLTLEGQELMFNAIDALIERYPEYAEFSEDFGFIDHMKAIMSLVKGVNEIEVKSEFDETFIKEDPNDIQAGEDENFLS